MSTTSPEHAAIAALAALHMPWFLFRIALICGCRSEYVEAISHELSVDPSSIITISSAAMVCAKHDSRHSARYRP